MKWRLSTLLQSILNRQYFNYYKQIFTNRNRYQRIRLTFKTLLNIYDEICFVKKANSWKLLNNLHHAILERRLQTSSRNQIKLVFLWNVLQVVFGNFLARMSKFVLLVARWALAIKSKHFSDFLEISYIPKIFSLHRSACCEETRTFNFQ